MSLLSAAAQKGHMHALQYLIAEGVSLTDVNVVGNTPLFDAVVWGHAAAVKVLLNADSDVQHISHNGTTARHLEHSAELIAEVPSKTAFLEWAKVLLDAGANIDHVDSSGHSSLSNAAVGGSVDLVQQLVAQVVAVVVVAVQVVLSLVSEAVRRDNACYGGSTCRLRVTSASKCDDSAD
jgi:uncharacterized protein